MIKRIEKILTIHLYAFSIAFVLLGCSSLSGDRCNLNFSLVEIKKNDLGKRNFDEKISRFQYLLKNSLDSKLSDINNRKFQCSKDRFFELRLTYKCDDLYDHLKEHKSLHKHSSLFSLHYDLHDLVSGKKVLSGKIKSIDSFITPSHFYSDVLSSDDSMIAAIDNLTKQLELELLSFATRIRK